MNMFIFSFLVPNEHNIGQYNFYSEAAYTCQISFFCSIYNFPDNCFVRHIPFFHIAYQVSVAAEKI